METREVNSLRKRNLLVASIMIGLFMLFTLAACQTNSHTNTNSSLIGQGENVDHDDKGFTSSTSSHISSDQIPLPIDIELPIPGLRPGDNNHQQPRVPNQLPGMPVPNHSPEQSPDVNASVMARESRVMELTNKERRNHGLHDLQADPSLSGVAREKSNDMQKNNYFSHTSPTYGSPFDMMRDMGVSYTAAGENIAMGQQTPEEVVAAWMNSEGHRANILRGDYTHIGVGYIPNGNYWTQMFISK